MDLELDTFNGFGRTSLIVPLISVKPSKEDFYTQPEGCDNHRNGDTLKMIPTPQKLRSVFLPINIKDSWQKSTDSFGNTTAIITALMESYNTDPSNVVLYQAIEDSAALDFAPSYEFSNDNL